MKKFFDVYFLLLLLSRFIANIMVHCFYRIIYFIYIGYIEEWGATTVHLQLFTNKDILEFRPEFAYESNIQYGLGIVPGLLN